jgi:hypothetical protein
MTRLLVLKYVDMLAVMLTVVWLAREPGWEPAVVLVGLLSAFIVTDWSISRKATERLAEIEQLQAKLAEAQPSIIELRERLESEKTRAERAEATLQEVGEKLERLRDRIGYQIGKVEIRIYILDFHGTCHVHYLWTDITRVRPDLTLDRVPGRLRFSAPGSIFSTYPKLTYEYIRKYDIEFLRREAAFCEFHVLLNGATNNISFEYTADIERAFRMSEGDLAGERHDEEQDEHEWYEFYISTAIESLTISVNFPRHYRPTITKPDAYVGFFPNNKSDEAEVKRIIENGDFEFDSISGSALMTVTKPIIGHAYCIRWQPMPAPLVEAMRQSGKNLNG